MHLSQHPLKVNDELSEDLIERCWCHWRFWKNTRKIYGLNKMNITIYLSKLDFVNKFLNIFRELIII